MTGSGRARTLASEWGAGVRRAALDEDSPCRIFPVHECTGGDVGENVYTYRDASPSAVGQPWSCTYCALKAGEQVIRVSGSAVRLDMCEVPRYIEHIRPQ